MTEIITNALIHSRAEFLVVLVSVVGGVRVEVHGTSLRRPDLRRRGSGAHARRGLVLVDVLVDAWGFDDERPS